MPVVLIPTQTFDRLVVSRRSFVNNASTPSENVAVSETS